MKCYDGAPKSKTVSFSFTCLDVSSAFAIANAGNRKQLLLFLIMSYHRICSLNRHVNNKDQILIEVQIDDAYISVNQTFSCGIDIHEDRKLGLC